MMYDGERGVGYLEIVQCPYCVFLRLDKDILVTWKWKIAKRNYFTTILWLFLLLLCIYSDQKQVTFGQADTTAV